MFAVFIKYVLQEGIQNITVLAKNSEEEYPEFPLTFEMVGQVRGPELGHEKMTKKGEVSFCF